MNSLFKKILLVAAGTLLLFLVVFFFFILPSLKNSAPPSPTSVNPTSIPPPIQTYPTVIKNVQNQGQADENFGNAMKNSRAPYPWYASTPLQTNNYFVYFDIPQKKFFGKIYSTSNNLSGEQIIAIKTEVQVKLQTLGATPEQYPVEWQTGL